MSRFSVAGPRRAAALFMPMLLLAVAAAAQTNPASRSATSSRDFDAATTHARPSDDCPHATSTSLAAPAQLTCGSTLVLNVTVTPTSEGTATFYDGANDLGDVVVDGSGLASLSVPFGLAIGTHSLTATFVSDDPCAEGSTSPVVSHEVNAITTTLALSAPSDQNCGSKLTMTATVSPASTGTVTFYDGPDPIATASVSSGVATASIPGGLFPGVHSLVASYTPVASCAGPSTSNTVTHTSHRIPTTLAIHAPAQAPCGGSFTLSATVNPVFAGIVRFFDGANQIGSAPVTGFGLATLTGVTGLATGSHMIAASFSPGVVCAEASVSDSATLEITIASSSVTITSSPNPSHDAEMVSIVAHVSPSNAQGLVELFDGATSLGTAPVTQGLAAFANVFSQGTHDLTAVFSDGSCWMGSTSPVRVQQVLPPPSVSISNADVVEGDTGIRFLQFTVSISSLMNRSVNVHATTFDGTATLANNDYQAVNQIVTVPNGQLSTTLQIPVVGDYTAEPDEQLTVVLSDPDIGTLGSAVGIGRIHDDDIPLILMNAVSRAEGDAGSSPFTFTVTLSKRVDIPVTVDWHTEDVTATVANHDYEPGTGQVTFAPLDTVETLSVLVYGDSTFEDAEAFEVRLENATNGVIAFNPVTGTIQNDDAAPRIVVDDASVAEGDFGTVDLVFPVRLLNGSSDPVQLSYETLNGTALAGSDFVGTTGILHIDPKEHQGVVVVKVFGDQECESPDETFSLRIFGPHGGTIVDNTGIATIVDEDCVASIDPIALRTLPLLELSPILPNPARVARLRFAIGRPGSLRLIILDVQGREVARLADAVHQPGRYEVIWSGVGDRGPAAAGLYFARCRGAGKTVTRPFVLTR